MISERSWLMKYQDCCRNVVLPIEGHIIAVATLSVLVAVQLRGDTVLYELHISCTLMSGWLCFSWPANELQSMTVSTKRRKHLSSHSLR